VDDPLAGSSAKIKRAATHLDLLHKEIRAFHNLDPKPYRFITKVDVDTSRYVMRVRLDADLPVEWSLIAGDFVHNLRSALDHMVWQFVLTNGGKPSRMTSFPIRDTPPGDPNDGARRSWDPALAAVGSSARDLVARCQPYRGTDTPDGRHLLSALRDLSNEDKHRVVLARYVAIEQPSTPLALDVLAVRDVRPLTTGQLYTGRALKDGDLVLEAPVEITGPNPEVTANGELPLDVGFGDDPIVPLKGLRQMVETVAQVVAEGRSRLP